MDPHDAIEQFRQDKLDEMEAWLAKHCPHEPRHHATQVLRSIGLCDLAATDERFRCWDSMVYLLDDLHATIWTTHDCHAVPLLS